MTIRGVLGVVLCAIAAAGATRQSQYCRFTRQHTMCQYQGIGPACNQLQEHKVSAREAKLIVAEHNRLRAQVTNGQEYRGQTYSQPSASNMQQLEWDEELARVAQRHADQCVFQHDCSDCRRVARFQVGQNLAVQYSTGLRKGANWKKAIDSWYDEVKTFNPQSIHPFRLSRDTGHYTQMLWAETSLVGCGYTMYKNGDWWTKLYTCTYGESGNWKSGQMYAMGAPCSKCPAGTRCSSQYRGLCAGGGGSGQVAPPAPELPSPSFGQGPAASNDKSQLGNQQWNPKPDQALAPSPLGVNSDGAPSPNQLPQGAQNDGAHAPAPSPFGAQNNEVQLPNQSPPGAFGGGNDIASGQPNAATTLLSCDLDYVACTMEYDGATWQILETSTDQRKILATTVKAGESTEVVFQKVIQPPPGGIVCIHFSYMKFETHGHQPVPLVVSLQTVGGPGGGDQAAATQNVKGSMQTVMAQWDSLTQPTRLHFSVAVPGSAHGQVTIVELDDIKVTAGQCSTAVQ